MSINIPHMNSWQSTVQPGALLCGHFTLLTLSLNKYTCHITYVCPIALIMQSTCRPHSTANRSQKQQTASFTDHAVTICGNKYALKCQLLHVLT